MNSPAVADEDLVVIPTAWHQHVDPRRGGRVPAPAQVDPAAAAAARTLTATLTRQWQSRIEATQRAWERGVNAVDPNEDDTDPSTWTTAASRQEVGRAGLNRQRRRDMTAFTHLAGRPSPLGAAVVAERALSLDGRPKPATSAQFADLWVEDHGFVFAARAAVELANLHVIVVNKPEQCSLSYGDCCGPIVRRLRALIAAQDDDSLHEAIADAVQEYRTRRLAAMVASFLVPGTRNWASEDIANCVNTSSTDLTHGLPLLLASIGPNEEISGRPGLLIRETFQPNARLLANLVDGLGVDAVEWLISFMARDADVGSILPRGLDIEALATVFAMLPDDRAIDFLISRFGEKHGPGMLLTYCNRFPRRAIRRLASALAAEQADPGLTRLFWRLCRRYPAAAGAELPALDETRRAAADAAIAANPADTASEADLPRVLIDPPWAPGHRKPKAVTLPGLVPPADTIQPVLRWAGDEQQWRGAEISEYDQESLKLASALIRDQDEFHRLVAEYADDDLPGSLFGLQRQPDGNLRPEDWLPAELYPDSRWARVLVARHGAAALPLLLQWAAAAPATVAPFLLPFLSIEVARLMADWLTRKKGPRTVAVEWFGRHGVSAVRLLIPDALGKQAAPRRRALTALLSIAEQTSTAQVIAAATDYGPEAAAAIAAAVDVDPIELAGPTTPPRVGGWADPALLPPLLLRDSDRVLSEEATRHAITVLAVSTPAAPHPGIEVLEQTCDPRSLVDFCWAIFLAWQDEGMPSSKRWAFTNLSLFGNDEIARRIAPLIRRWPGEGAHQRSVTGLEILRSIGSDVALLHLYLISRTVTFEGLAQDATEKITAIGAARGLTTEQTMDRLVPDFGLGKDGTLTLDFGSRRCTVGFDEKLAPLVTDHRGQISTSLPKPTAKDDPELVAAARAAYAGLRADVKAIAADQIDRLEQTMLRQRRWPFDDFRAFLVEHPLLTHLTRRLVWIAEPAEGRPTAFRVAEDGSLADIEDDEFLPGTDAQIRVAHPIDLGDDLARWSEIFADYLISQPFRQLGRSVHILSESERTGNRLTRFDGKTTYTSKVRALCRRNATWTYNGDTLCMPLVDGSGELLAQIGEADDSYRTPIEAVWLVKSRWGDEPDNKLPLSRLNPVEASELIETLVSLTS